PLLPRSIRPPTSATLFPYTTLIRSFRPDAGGLPLEVLDGLVDVVGQVQPIDVGLLDHPAGEHGAAQPVQQRGPVVDADEHDGETGDLARLGEGDRLEDLVESAEAPRQHEEALAVLDEHRLAREEVAEVDAEVDVGIQPRLEGEFDAQADGGPAGLTGTLVRGLHGARAAAGDHGVAGLAHPTA